MLVGSSRVTTFLFAQRHPDTRVEAFVAATVPLLVNVVKVTKNSGRKRTAAAVSYQELVRRILLMPGDPDLQRFKDLIELEKRVAFIHIKAHLTRDWVDLTFKEYCGGADAAFWCSSMRMPDGLSELGTVVVDHAKGILELSRA